MRMGTGVYACRPVGSACVVELCNLMILGISILGPSEALLMKELLRLPQQIRLAAEQKGPHRLAAYLREVATAFSAFYRDCRIIGEAEGVATARLALAEATRLVLRNGLTVLGISAPDRMDREYMERDRQRREREEWDRQQGRNIFGGSRNERGGLFGPNR